MKVNYTYFVISSTRQAGIWGEEQLEVPVKNDFQLAKGFTSFNAAHDFLLNEVKKLYKEPGFYRSISWIRTNEGHTPPEYCLTYEYLSASDKQWRPIKLKFRITEKTFVVLDEEEVPKAKFF